MPSIIIGTLAWLWVLQASYGPFKTYISHRFLFRQRQRLDAAAQTAPKRGVALIVAAKGVPTFFDRFLELVLAQDYGNYRLIFVTESAEDPARLALQKYLDLDAHEERWIAPKPGNGCHSVELVVAGLAENEGQKVHNQLAAFRHLTPRDEIIAFADADIVGSRHWLEQLVTPINAQETEFTTGYRWFIPETSHLANLVATNINSGIGVLAGPSWHTILWGGSMAMSRASFDELKVPELLTGSLNDDLQITRMARQKRKKMLFVRSLMAPTPVNYTWASLFEFGRRQYFQVRVYVTRFWLTALLFTTLWLAGVASAWAHFLLNPRWLTALPILLVAGCTILRFFLLRAFQRVLFEPETVKHLEPAWRIGLFTTTFNFAIHWCIILSSALIQEISWAGIRYRVTGRQETEVLSRRS